MLIRLDLYPAGSCVEFEMAKAKGCYSFEWRRLKRWQIYARYARRNLSPVFRCSALAIRSNERKWNFVRFNGWLEKIMQKVVTPCRPQRISFQTNWVCVSFIGLRFFFVSENVKRLQLNLVKWLRVISLWLRNYYRRITSAFRRMYCWYSKRGVQPVIIKCIYTKIGEVR